MKLSVVLAIPFYLIANGRIAVCQNNAEKALEEPTFCLTGTIALPPPNPVICFNQNEIFACAFGEARCDGLGYCGTPPCIWRCWCRNGYKRNANGTCVKFCSYPQVAYPQLPQRN